MRARLGLEKVVDIEPGTRESEGVQEAHVDAERRFPPPVPDVVRRLGFQCDSARVSESLAWE